MWASSTTCCPLWRSLVVLGFGVYLSTGSTQRMCNPEFDGVDLTNRSGGRRLNPTLYQPMNWSRISSINLRQPVISTHSKTMMDTSSEIGGISILVSIS